MQMSPSEPSIGTSITHTSNREGSLILNKSIKPDKNEVGVWFWEGRPKRVTQAIILLPCNIWWKSIVVITIVYKFTVNFLMAYYFSGYRLSMDISLALSEAVYLVDVFIHLLHVYWPIVRQQVRTCRRHRCALFFDLFTLIPLSLVSRLIGGYTNLMVFGRWLGILRIYRLYVFFDDINGAMRKSRTTLLILQHTTWVLLFLHAFTCIWYNLLKPSNGHNGHKVWYNLGYPSHVNSVALRFENYSQCWYYCACRFLNIIFGDSFPMNDVQKWFTISLMVIGYIGLRYKLIGQLAWELANDQRRWSWFRELYHHMLNYLKCCGAPLELVEQSRQYKQQLWDMKEGILSSSLLEELPLPLQMELIFDINVGHFHNSLLFRGSSEAFMRQISLLMKHELFLAGQQVWSQGVVKGGMICIKRGVLEMLSDEDDESPMIAFQEGTVLGELSLFYSIPSKVTVKAATYVELQVLRRTDFMRISAENPILHEIREKIDTRLKKAINRQKAIEEYDKGDSRLLRTRYRPMKVLKDNLAGVEEEDPTFVDDSHMYYRDENNVRQPKFTTSYLELYNMAANVTTVDEPRICLKSNFPWILEPDTDFTHMFDILHFIMVIYVCIMAPLHAIEMELSELENVADIIVKAGLLLNIYIQLTTSIDDKIARKETIKEIAEVKLSTVGFYLDVLSVSPLYIFSQTLDPHGETICDEVALLLPVLQVWHLWDYMDKWEKSFHSNNKVLCVLKYGMLLMIFCYWSGCFLYMYSCPRKLCRENSWMALLIFRETKVYATYNAKHERPMLSAMSLGTAIFTGVGISDLAPGITDLWIVVILSIVGTYLHCIYTAKITSLYLLSSKRRHKFREQMMELSYFLTVNRVSAKIKARVKKFFLVQWYYNKAVSPQEIFKDMSSNIEQEVLSIEMVETLLFCPIFQECNKDFLQTVAANTRTVVLPDNEIVQHAADISRDMYILQKGYCKILDCQGKVIDTRGPGSHFSVIEMLFGLPKVYTVLTRTNCVLRHVEYTALVKCWSLFPEVSHPLNMVLQDPELRSMKDIYEDAKPLVGKIDAKTNRIAQEIKESFVVLSGRAKEEYVRVYEKLGILRYIRYIFFPGCITPHGIFLKLWCIFRMLLAVYYTFLIPYCLATLQYKHCHRYRYVDVFLYIDIAVMAYVSYYNERSLLVTHPLLTVSRYLTHAFFWDLLSIFPFELLFQIVNENTNTDLCRINRLLLVTRITGAFSFWEKDIIQVNAAVVLMKFLPFAIAFVNLITAWVFMNSCTPFMIEEELMANCTRSLKKTSRKFELVDARKEYMATIFWVFEMFVGCGCTPTTIMCPTDVYLVMVLQVTGYLYFAFMFGYVASTRSSSGHALLQHNEKTRDLENFLYQENVDPDLTAKTLKYFEYMWKRTNGSNAQRICRRLNSALMEDTLVFMYERALREVPLFGKVERSFIRVITQHLTEMYFLKGETIVQCQDIQQNIYIIYRGKVDVLNSYNEMVTCMGPGGMFGNFTGQPTSCSEVAIFASRSLDLLVIPSQTFFNLVKYYPKIREPLTKAFETSKDYILPISMDVMDDDSTEESDKDIRSTRSSMFDSQSGSVAMGEFSAGLSKRSSQSNVSQAKSSLSIATYQSYLHVTNVLRPGSYLFQMYGYLTCLVATANYMVTLYQLITLNDCIWLFWTNSVMDIYFYIKVFLSMHQGYVNKHGELVTEDSKCRGKYFSNQWQLWCDLFVNVPLDFLGFCFPNRVTSMHYLRINKIFRLKYVIDFYRITAAELTNNITTLQLMTTFIVMVLLFHTFTCLWLLSLTAISPICKIRMLKMNIIDKVSPMSVWDYTTSFYIVISQLTNTGGDEFEIEGTVSRMILFLVLIFGKIIAAMVVSTSIQVSYSNQCALNKYEMKSGNLIDMLKNQGLSDYQSKKFWKYVQQLWVTERGRQLPVLLAETPYVRRCDLMAAMFGHHLRHCYLFADTGEAFLRQLTVVLDFTIFFPGNYIVVAGDSDTRMFWVESGTVAVVSVRADLTEHVHEHLVTGDVFGILQGLNRGISHCFSYRAETRVGILTLSLDSWINILPFFPEAQKIINERSEILFAQL